MTNISYVNNMVFSLILVFIAIAVSAYIYKKIRFSIGKPSNKINILSSMAIGSKEKLILLDVEGKKLLIGATNTNIRTLFVKDSFGGHLENIINHEGSKKC